MWAADHLVQTGGLPGTKAERLAVLNAFDEALRRMPESFDTGEGVKCGDHLRLAREAYLHKTKQLFSPPQLQRQLNPARRTR